MSHRSRVYGHIPGVSFGARFTSRDGLMRSGVHAMSQGGIHGDPNQDGGAFSICLSEGYEDNQDLGDRIIYVGSGGQDTNGQQRAHQSFDDPPNQSMLISSQTRRPVRVVRGRNGSSYYAPSSGYRYDGLYYVHSATMRPGRRGFDMCVFDLRRIREEGDGPVPNRRLLTMKRMNNMLRRVGK